MRREFNSVLILLLLLPLGIFFRQAEASPTNKKFTVTHLSDASDARIDGNCNDGSGGCTLRAAIEEANATAEQDE
ncbi:MAG: hypothetical protein K8I82_16400, partial [Anaerolineae bacterium]|nr:hypothetical protein [Anaerolineae bacterium]